MPTTEAEIFNRVTETLVQALGIAREEVSPEATLIADLGAESIDLLDIAFRLERDFNIKIPRGALFPDDMLKNPAYVREGRLTSTGLDALRTALPHLNLAAFEEDLRIENLTGVFTVRSITDYLRARLDGA